MRAVVVARPGPPDGLEIQDVPIEQPAGSEILVAVKAAALNRADLLQRRGLYAPPAGYDAARLGLEYAGEVIACGAHCALRKVGDRVMGLMPTGAQAEFVTVQERETIIVPDGVAWEVAGAFPEAFLTAYRALVVEGGFKPGGSCLVRGATSAVGQAVVQWARLLGATCVLATGRSMERLERVHGASPDDCFAEGSGELARWVENRSPGGVQVVVDLVGGETLGEHLACLAEDGSWVLLGLLGGMQTSLNLGALLLRRLTLRAMTMRSLPLEQRIGLSQTAGARGAAALAAGTLQVTMDQALPLTQVRLAHERMEAGCHFGKLVLLP